MGLGPTAVQGDATPLSVNSEKSKKWWKNGEKKEGMKRRWWNRFCLTASCVLRSKLNGPVSKFSIKNAKSKCITKVSEDIPSIITVSTSSTDCPAESCKSGPIACRELVISSQLRRFTFNELRCATRSFRPETLLGEGGFGCVFKGWVEENGTAPMKPGLGLTVAVKTLNHDGLQGHKEWLAEVNFLGNLIHPNLVKLIGYCIEDDQRLLVYEFMPRGSLENHLFRRSLPLPWSTRMKIAHDVAKGLAFLHEEAERPVIYRDFKTSNILLDVEYNAKLSDFGLAKDGPEGDKTHVSTRVMGTYGYAAPEYVMTGHLTSKSDVYSFGVVFLEMLTGRRSMDKKRPHGEHNLVEWARPFLRGRRRFYQLIDPRLEGHFSVRGSHKAVQLASQCLNRDPKARPRMSEVVEALKPLMKFRDMAVSSSLVHSLNSRNGRAPAPNQATMTPANQGVPTPANMTAPTPPNPATPTPANPATPAPTNQATPIPENQATPTLVSQTKPSGEQTSETTANAEELV